MGRGETVTQDYKDGMEFAAKIAELCSQWYEGHGDKVGELAAEEIRARISAGVRGDIGMP
jgi:hypothetical protein